MRAIFICYRRQDAAAESRNLYRDLSAAHFEVFMDVRGVRYGVDFRNEIEDKLASCGVLLAVIGSRWLDSSEDGKSRLDVKSDYVRVEITAALKRNIPVIPVLVQGAPLPAEDRLPEDLRPLVYRHGLELTHERWEGDVQLLIDALHPYLDDQPKQPAGDSEVLESRSSKEKPRK